MHLTPEQKAKADPLLQEILDHSSNDEVLQVVMVLDDDKANLSPTETLKPSQFSSRVEYRKALIEKRKQQLEMGTVGQTITALNNLDLTIHGGKASRFLVVEGTAEEILKSLFLSGIKSVTLDQIIRIEPTPIDPKIVEYLSNLILEIIPGDKDKIFQAAKQYISNYYKSYGQLQLKFWGMRKSTPLEDIYTTVKVLDKKSIRQYIYPDDMEKNFKTRKSFHKDKNPTGIDVANQDQFLMVLGGPGSGKSTLLRKVGLDSIKGILDHQCIPIFIELKQFNNLQNIDLLATIKTIFRDCDFPNIDQFINQGLQQGKFIILFDGLDEVSNKTMEKLVDEIEKIVKNYRKNRFIISCRTAAYQQQFDEFNNVSIADFDQIQIRDFINNWFSSEIDQRAETAKKCLQALEVNIGAKELAKTPLLLTFICLVSDESQTLPKNRSDLYKKALEILLEKWSAEKRLERDPLYKDFTTKSEIMLLSEIAYEGFVEDKLFFTTQELVNKIKRFLSKKLNAHSNLDGEAVLNAISIQQGILVERLDNIYSFSHLTLQEYLTAKYIVDNNLIQQTVTNHVTDTRWKEVFILIAGLMEGKTGADQLLLLMENEAIEFLKTTLGMDKLIPLLDWGERITTGSVGDIKPVAKKSIAYSMILMAAIFKPNTIDIAKTDSNAINLCEYMFNTWTRAIAYTKTEKIPNPNSYEIILSRFVDCANRLEKEDIFTNVNFSQLIDKLEGLKINFSNDQLSQEKRCIEINNVFKVWQNEFDVTSELIHIKLPEVEEIDQNYFYIYHLMLQCKDAAELVTNKTWSAIEERMYRVPS